MSKLSSFVIKRGFDCSSFGIESICLLSDGSLLVTARNLHGTGKILKALSSLCLISSKHHEALNLMKGVIYAPCAFLKPK